MNAEMTFAHAFLRANKTFDLTAKITVTTPRDTIRIDHRIDEVKMSDEDFLVVKSIFMKYV